MEDNLLKPLMCYSAPSSPCLQIDNNFLINNADINNSTIVGTCIINDCEPCIKVASYSSVSIYKGRTFIKNTRTNGCGNYVFTNLEPGRYTVSCQRKGLIPKCKNIEIGENSIYMLNLLLERKRNC